MIHLPVSKSIGARYLVATFFARTLPADPLFEDNDDLMVLQQALLEIFSDEEPIDFGDTPIDVGASGTAMRFVSAVCASTPGADYVVAGTPRLMSRPMTPLLNLLQQAGAGIESLGGEDKGPYRIKGGNLQGGDFTIRGDVSSQFVSAVMLAAPYWEKGVRLRFSTPLVSRPYVEMTARLLDTFGVKCKLTDMDVTVEHGEYKIPKKFRVEADWSSASFFYEGCAIGGIPVELADLTAPELSLQGDSRVADLFLKLGVDSTFSANSVTLERTENREEVIEVDFKDCPDLVLPYAMACLCQGVKFRFVNVAHLRLKESDRIESLQKEALKLGFVISADENEIKWDGAVKDKETDPLIETYDDHRVAMSFAMAALKFGKIRISHPEVVEKSFIDFWNQIELLGLKCNFTGTEVTVTKE